MKAFKIVLLVVLCLLLFVSIYQLLRPDDTRDAERRRQKDLKKVQAELDKLNAQEADTDRQIRMLNAVLKNPDAGH